MDHRVLTKMIPLGPEMIQVNRGSQRRELDLFEGLTGPQKGRHSLLPTMCLSYWNADNGKVVTDQAQVMLVGWELEEGSMMAWPSG